MTRPARQALVLLATALLAALALAAAASAASSLESMFQDDAVLLNSGPDTARRSLDELQGLGVRSVHSLVVWAQVAPERYATERPDGFDPADPADYPAENWAKYDTLVREAAARGISVLFSPTVPAPAWAGRCTSEDDRNICRVKPNARQYGAFVTALAKRYSGSYPDPANPGTALPRVSRWSFLNEPNLGAWLRPQYQRVRGRVVAIGAKIARDLLYAGIDGMRRNGHAADQLYIAETAPVGDTRRTSTSKNPPRSFLRDLFCLSSRGRALVDSRIGCSRSFRRFQVTGITHHPYTFGAGAPPFSRTGGNDITIGSLSRLTGVLRQAAARGRISSAAAGRIYLSEFGYQTNPPDDRFGVSWAKQAEYINQGDYIAYRTKGVRALAQYELYDDPAENSFNTGLRVCGNASNSECASMLAREDLQAGEVKASYDAYRLPLYVVRVSSTKVRVFAWVRPARGAQPVRIKVTAGRGDDKTERTVNATTRPNGILDTRLNRPSGSPRFQLFWTDGAGNEYKSRKARVALR